MAHGTKQGHRLETSSVKGLVAKSTDPIRESLDYTLGTGGNTWLQSRAASVCRRVGSCVGSRILSERDEKQSIHRIRRTLKAKPCTRNKKALTEINYVTVQDMM